jgi:hypothetical protein
MVFPCHQYSFGVEKPSVPHQYNLSFTDSWSECVLDIVTIKREILDASPVHVAYMKDLATRISNDSLGQRGKMTSKRR